MEHVIFLTKVIMFLMVVWGFPMIASIGMGFADFSAKRNRQFTHGTVLYRERLKSDIADAYSTGILFGIISWIGVLMCLTQTDPETGWDWPTMVEK